MRWREHFYLNQIDKLINRAYRYGYISGKASIKEIINQERLETMEQNNIQYKERIAPLTSPVLSSH